MGKVLIVKDADFSPNAIDVVYPDWYLHYNNSTLEGTKRMISGDFYIAPAAISELSLANKEVKYIKCYAYAEGVIQVGIVNDADDTETATRGNSYSYSVSKGVNIIELKESITLTSTSSLFVSGTILTYNSISTATGWDFLRIGSNTTFTSKIPIDFGGVPQE